MLILNLFEEQLTVLIGQEPFQIRILNEKVNTFNITILNILSNFIPLEILTCDDKNPPWFNKKIKGINQEKIMPLRKYLNSNIVLKTCLRSVQVRLNSSIECAKEKFCSKIANELNDTQKNAKACWSLIKMLLNNKKNISYSSFILR